MTAEPSYVTFPDAKWRKLIRSKLLNEYKPISDYALIGDQKTCALVGIDGSIDWFCVPKFDSPSVFGAIIDRRKGGSFRIIPSYNEFESRQYYEEHTNILLTEFRTNQGQIRLIDFMPCFNVSGVVVSTGEIHRRISCVEGEFEFDVNVEPRMNYGSAVPDIAKVEKVGYSFVSKEDSTPQELALITPLDFNETSKGTLLLQMKLKQNDTLDLVLRYGGIKLHHTEDTHTDVKLKETRSYWERWARQCEYAGKWREHVLRSALALKLLFYSPTGAIVAAPTTSLPEQIRGSRNWDYRYSWIRDSSFVLWAFHSIGHDEAESAYLNWLISIFYLAVENMQIMLGIGGERVLRERTLSHLEGYKGSSPVRIGNGA